MKQECEECNGRGYFRIRIYEEGTEIDEVECENCKGLGTVEIDEPEQTYQVVNKIMSYFKL